MTYSTHELRAVVSAEVLEWRQWRRSMHLTQTEAAAMADVDMSWLNRIEVGKVSMGARTRAKLRVLMARWGQG